MTESLLQTVQKIARETSDVYAEHDSRMAALLTQIDQSGRRLPAGTPAPDFLLPNTDGKLMSLSSLMGDEGLVILFMRGLWCPYCNAQLSAFRENRKRIADKGLNVVVITPEVNGRAAETKMALQLPFEVLCDADSITCLEYGCLFRMPDIDQKFFRKLDIDLGIYYGNDSWFLPLATTFLIAPDKTVQQSFSENDQRWRTGPDVVLNSLGI